MHRIIRSLATAAAVTAPLAACGAIDAYEAAVEDWEPTYCYQSIGGATCFRQPYHRDERRLVNYFGPHPSRYEAPEPPELAPIGAPPGVNYWVKDAEPIPRPAPTGPVSELAWLDPARIETQKSNADYARRAADPAATRAFLNRLGVGPEGQLQAMPPRRLPGRPNRELGAAPGAEAAAEAAQKTAQPAAKPTRPAEPPLIEVEVN